jgi:subtilase family serine protease
MKRRSYAFLAGLLLSTLGFAQSKSLPLASNIFVPESSKEAPGDAGKKFHTNYVIYVGHKVPDPVYYAVNGGPLQQRIFGYTPAQMRTAYSLPPTGASGVICIVDAYHYPNALSDFNTFAAQFNLPQETSADQTLGTNKVFQVVYANGTSTPPPTDPGSGWEGEEALDIEWAHAMAPNAKIVLVECESSLLTDLFAGVTLAGSYPGCVAVSNSYASQEFNGENSFDSTFLHPGTIYFASAGDNGHEALYPSSSPNVISAGGTSLTLDSVGNRLSESGWSGSGGGSSSYEARPAYQAAVSSIVGNMRGVPDIAYNADPNTGVAVYCSFGSNFGWEQVGGTSLSAPALAGMFVNSGKLFNSSADALAYIYSGLGGPAYYDITTGSNGLDCTAGWDFVTGVGSPHTNGNAGSITGLTATPTAVMGGVGSSGKITVSAPSQAGLNTCNLTSDHPSILTLPASVTVPVGTTTATFAMATHGVAALTHVIVSANYIGTIKTCTLDVKPAALNRIALSRTTVISGGGTQLSLILDANAPSGGASVALSSSNPQAAPVPASAAVPYDLKSKNIVVTSRGVDTSTVVTFTATYKSIAKTAQLTVSPASLTALTVTPTSVYGGQTSLGRATFDGAAPASGSTMTVTSGTPAVATAPATVNVAANGLSQAFTITTHGVGTSTPVVFTVAFKGVQKTATLTVSPATLSKITLSATTVFGGKPVTATIFMNGQAGPSGAPVDVKTSNTAVATVVTPQPVAANSSTRAFTVTTKPVAAVTTITVTATYAGLSKSATLTVTPLLVSAFSISPASVSAGNSATGTITLNAPASGAGAVISISNTGGSAVSAPTSVTVPAGATTKTFTISSNPAAPTTTVTFTVTYNGASKTATLDVNGSGIIPP